MNPQTIAAVRIVIVAIGSLLVGRGLVSQETMDTLSDPVLLTAVAGGLAALVSAGYGIYSRRPHGIIKDAAKLPQVEAVVVKPKTASEIPAENVVGSVEEAEKVVKAPRHRAKPVPPVGTGA